MKLYLTKDNGYLSLKFYGARPDLPYKFNLTYWNGGNVPEYAFKPDYDSRVSFEKQTIDFIEACKTAGIELTDNIPSYIEYLQKKEREKSQRNADNENREKEERRTREEEKKRLDNDMDYFVSKTSCTSCKGCKFNCSYLVPWHRYCRYINEKAKAEEYFDGEYRDGYGRTYLFGENKTERSLAFKAMINNENKQLKECPYREKEKAV